MKGLVYLEERKYVNAIETFEECFQVQLIEGNNA